MAVPTFVAAGSSASGTGAVTVVWPTSPAHQANDIGLLFVETANQAVTLSTAAGFVEVTNSPQGTGTAGGTAATRLTVFWCRATSSAQASPVIATGNDHAFGRILVFRGCTTSGNPWNITAGDVLAAASTTVTIPGASTSVAECLVVAGCAHGIDIGTGNKFTTWRNASLTSVTARSDTSTTSGNGGGVGVAVGGKTAAGAYSATTATLASSSTQGRLSIALAPVTANVTVTPGVGAPVFAGLLPAALLTIRILTDVGAPVFSGFAPTVRFSTDLGAMVFAGQSPAVQIGSNTVIQPGTAAPIFSGQAPTILVTVRIPTGLGQPVFGGLAPVAKVSDNKFPAPGLGQPVFTGLAPNVVAAVTAKPDVGQPVLAGLAPIIVLTDNQRALTGLGQPIFTGLAPVALIGTGQAALATPGRGQVTFAGFTPLIIGSLIPAPNRDIATVAWQTAESQNVSIPQIDGTSIMDTFTCDDDTGTIDDDHGTIDDAPMRYMP